MKPTLLLTACLLPTLHAGSVAAPEWLAGIAPGNKLVMFASDSPDDVTVVKVKGLQKKEKLVGIDVRPLNGQLYGLGSTSRLYTINWETGQATAIGTVPLDPLVAGSSISFDFNPTVDRIRIMTDAGQNLRAHPDTGAVVSVDGSLAYAAGDSGFAAVPGVTACAYTNNDNDPLTGTTLYDIDSTRDVLVRQDPPNAGTLNTVGPLGVDASEIVGFDIAGSNGTAYASMVVRQGKKKNLRATLFSIDLTTGAATSLGKISGPWPLSSLTAIGPVAD